MAFVSLAFVSACQEGGDAVAVADSGTRADSGAPAADAGTPADSVIGGSAKVTHALATSSTHACALRDAGLYCWGENFSGQLGTGDTVDSMTAVAAKVAGMDVVDVAVATGRTCVRRGNGQVACWGANTQGQIGNGTRTDSTEASAAKGINDAVELAITDNSTCIARKDGRVACWGNAGEQADSAGAAEPVSMPGLAGIVELASAGESGYCGRDKAGAVSCWHFAEGAWSKPDKVGALAGARMLAMSHTQVVCASVPSHEISCHSPEFEDVFALQNSAGFEQVSGGDLVACGINGEGHGRCWNVTPQFQLEIPSDMPLLEIAISGLSVCVLRKDKSVACAHATDLAPVPVDVALPD